MRASKQKSDTEFMFVSANMRTMPVQVPIVSSALELACADFTLGGYVPICSSTMSINKEQTWRQSAKNQEEQTLDGFSN
jgi:hypothetical protein